MSKNDHPAPLTARPLPLAVGADIKTLACRVGGVSTFTELAVTVMTKSLVRQGRPGDAERLLASYLADHPPTLAIQRLKQDLKQVFKGER